MKLKIKCVSPKPLFHVGTMDVADKGCRGSSYEGKGLSVSTEPDAWVVIAKLGGLPRFKVCKPDAKFIDFHALVEGKQALYQWGIQKGFLTTSSEIWRVSYHDDEWDREFVYYVDDRAEAREEKESGRNVRRMTNFPVPTEESLNRTGIKSKLTGVHDVLALLLAEEMGLDGVWWDDELDESRLSAPRGVILPERLKEFEVEKV